MGVVTCREVRSEAAIVAISLPSSCRNFLLQLLHRTIAYQPGNLSEVLTEHYRRAHPRSARPP